MGQPFLLVRNGVSIVERWNDSSRSSLARNAAPLASPLLLTHPTTTNCGDSPRLPTKRNTSLNWLDYPQARNCRQPLQPSVFLRLNCPLPQHRRTPTHSTSLLLARAARKQTPSLPNVERTLKFRFVFSHGITLHREVANPATIISSHKSS